MRGGRPSAALALLLAVYSAAMVGTATAASRGSQRRSGTAIRR